MELAAPIRFLSCEPLVEAITLAPYLERQQIQWVICGGYSGAQERPMWLSWARTLRDECRDWGVAFFMKQLGSVYARDHHLRHPKGEDPAEFPADLRIQAFPVPSLVGREKPQVANPTRITL